jgi:ferric-dicitrate binding protein FerR (iron transport regulator)
MRTTRLLLAFGLVAATPAAAAAEIGKATSIVRQVTGKADGSVRELKVRAPVLENELVRTDQTGIGEFEFLDRSRLAVGPNSEVKLDRFVFQTDRRPTAVAIELTRGVFRFISARISGPPSRISTRLATIGMRGTAFDLFVADNGALCLALINGSLDVCPTGGTCRAHNVVGRFLILAQDGSFQLLDRWDGSQLGGATFAVAMPFLASQSRLTPPLRASEAVVARYRALLR